LNESLVDRIIENTLKKKNKSLAKRSYTLKESTVKKLQEMKTYYFSPSTKYNDIVDLAICELYKKYHIQEVNCRSKS
jgi:hypothetical protein